MGKNIWNKWVCVYIYIYIYIDIWIPGSSKKTAILWSTTLQTSCPPRPPTHVVLWILCLAAFKKNSHFCWWCAALPITTLKLGLWGKVRYLCGFLWMAVFFFKNPVYIYTYICIYVYIYGYIYISIHTYWAYHGGDSVGCASQCGWSETTQCWIFPALVLTNKTS